MVDLREIKTTLVLDADNVLQILRKIWGPIDALRSVLSPGKLPPYMTIDEAAEHSRFSANTVRKAIQEGRLRASQPEGREYRILLEDFQAWMNPTAHPSNDVEESGWNLMEMRREEMGQSKWSLPKPTKVAGNPTDGWDFWLPEDAILPICKDSLTTVLSINWGACPGAGYGLGDKVHLWQGEHRMVHGMVVDAQIGKSNSKVGFLTGEIDGYNAGVACRKEDLALAVTSTQHEPHRP